MGVFRLRDGIVVVVLLAFVASPAAIARSNSENPDTPLRLAMYGSNSNERISLVVRGRVCDILASNDYFIAEADFSAIIILSDMRTLIEEYARIDSCLFQFASNVDENASDRPELSYAISNVSAQAPIIIPCGVIAISTPSFNGAEHGEYSKVGDVGIHQRPIDA